MDARQLLGFCDDVYYSANILGGRDNRDGARVYECDECRVLAFRGTLTEGKATVEDWVNDFHADLITDDRFPGRVHQGFASSITALWPSLLAISQRQTTDTSLWITGHSKGGALAFLAAWLLRDLRPKVLTFAAPRVGDAGFASAYDLDTWRYENPADLVPKLPPWRYIPVGCQFVAPASFRRPRGIAENHSLATGYKPWVM